MTNLAPLSRLGQIAPKISNRAEFAGCSNSVEDGACMSKSTNKLALEVGEWAVRVVIEHKRDHQSSHRAAAVSITEKIGCVPQTLHNGVKKV